MNNKSKPPNRYLICDIFASRVDFFVSDMKNSGNPANTFSTKRTALRKFMNWRRSRKNADSKPDESEVQAFVGKA